MTEVASRALMAVATRCLGGHRREWALAMEAEFEAAREGGAPLAFATGCLFAAWRELPTHGEGRFTLAGYALALLVAVPIAALIAAALLFDFPCSYLGPWNVREWPRAPLLNDGNRSAVPSLALLMTMLAASHLRIAWLVLDRDWARVAAAARLILALASALLIFTGVAFADFGSAFVQAAMSTVALAATAVLARLSPATVGEAGG